MEKYQGYNFVSSSVNGVLIDYVKQDVSHAMSHDTIMSHNLCHVHVCMYVWYIECKNNKVTLFSLSFF